MAEGIIIKTNVAVKEMLETYKGEIIDFMQRSYQISREESVRIVDKTGFEKSFLLYPDQFKHTEPSKIGKKAYEYWSQNE